MQQLKTDSRFTLVSLNINTDIDQIGTGLLLLHA